MYKNVHNQLTASAEMSQEEMSPLKEVALSNMPPILVMDDTPQEDKSSFEGRGT